VNHVQRFTAGCSKRFLSKAAASEDPEASYSYPPPPSLPGQALFPWAVR
jgi:hypothetical protein